jgi:predicted histone-like DNA-binding protein
LEFNSHHQKKIDKMKYKLVERKNPQQPQAAGKWYAAPVNDGRVTQKEIAAEIVELSSLARGDVSNVIDSLIDVLPKYLLMGKSVSLGDLGTFRLSFSSEGAGTPGEFHAGLIGGVRIVFIPSPALRESVKKAKFEKA